MYQALGKHVVVKAVYPEIKSHAKLILTTKEPQVSSYQVISVGREVFDVKVGDILPTPQYIMHTIKEDDQSYCVISYENIYAKKI